MVILKQCICKTIFSLLLICIIKFTAAQNARQTFYYNPKGFTFVPALSKPSIIYQGQLFAGTRLLTALFNHVNNEQLNAHFKKYKSNRTAGTVFYLAGVGLSIFSIIDRVSNDDKKFNWYILGGGIASSIGSGYFNSRAGYHLLNAAIVFDEATKKTGFIPAQSHISLSVPLTK